MSPREWREALLESGRYALVNGWQQGPVDIAGHSEIDEWPSRPPVHAFLRHAVERPPALRCECLLECGGDAERFVELGAVGFDPDKDRVHLYLELYLQTGC